MLSKKQMGVLAILLATAAALFPYFFFSHVGAASCQASISSDLSFGMSSPEVLALQKILNADTDTRIAVSGPGSPGNETQFFGLGTHAAVIRFQRKYGISPLAGFVGPLTRAKLAELCVSPSSSVVSNAQVISPITSPANCPLITKSLSIGNTDPEILILQKKLNTAAATQVALAGPGSPGNETMYFGPATFQAVIRFQELHAAEVLVPAGLIRGTGFVGAGTRAALNTICNSSVPGATSSGGVGGSSGGGSSGGGGGSSGGGGGGSGDGSNQTQTDTQAPTVPQNVHLSSNTTSSITLTWTASTDNTAVAGYTVRRNAVYIATTTTPSFTDTGLAASTTYAYTIRAFDAAGNVSAFSSSTSFTTKPLPPLQPPPPPPIPLAGWTTLAPSADSRMIYVSSSQGNDINDGLSPETPVKTLAKAKSLLRSGYPDWILLKRGDIWDNEVFGLMTKSGRNQYEPMVFTAYSTGERPRIDAHKPTSILSLWAKDSTVANHDIAIVGIHFRSFYKTATLTSTTTGNAPTCVTLFMIKNALVEDNYLQGCRQNLNVVGGNNITIRRNIIADAYDMNGGHSQGMYTTGINTMLVEENIFLHNGWQNGNVSNSYDPNAPLAPANAYNHAMYIQGKSYGKDTDIIVRGNIFTESSSNTIMLRPGGIVDDNLLVRNTFGIYTALNPSIVSNNVVIEGRHQYNGTNGGGSNAYNIGPGAQTIYDNNIAATTPNASQAFSLDTHVTFSGDATTNQAAVDSIPSVSFILSNNIAYNAGTGFRINALDGLDSGIVSNNIFHNTKAVSTTSPRIMYQYTISTTTLCGCGTVLYSTNAYYAGTVSTSTIKYKISTKTYAFPQWQSFAQDGSSAEREVQFKDPNRTIETYMAMLGKQASFDAFVVELRNQSKNSWRTEYTAAVINDYIRDGFNR